MPGILQIMTGQGVIVFTKIGEIRFGRKQDFYTVMNAVNVLKRIRIDQEIGLVANLNIEPFPKQMIEKVIRLLETGKEIAKIDSDCAHALSPPPIIPMNRAGFLQPKNLIVMLALRIRDILDSLFIPVHSLVLNKQIYVLGSIR